MENEISCFLTVFIGVISLLLNRFSCEPVVHIGDSYIYGQNIKYRSYEVHQFFSVPYAQSPVGELRFQKPVQIDSYPKTLKAVNISPDCEQYTIHPFPWYNFSSYKSEDCLYLNIWTPSDASTENQKAVMYWIHGGGFRYDSIQNNVYTGTVLAAESDIIVVKLTTSDPQLFGFFGEKNPSINKTTGKDMVRKIFKDFPDPESVVRHYLPDDVPEYAFDSVRYQVATAAGDYLIVSLDVYHAEKYAEKGGKVYSYFLLHRPTDSPWAPWMGAVHFTEVQFIFGRPFLHPSDYHQARELGISEQMIEIWSNFVKNVKPNLEFWPLYSKQNPTFKYLGGEIQGTGYDQGPHKENCEFFRPYFLP